MTTHEKILELRLKARNQNKESEILDSLTTFLISKSKDEPRWLLLLLEELESIIR